MNEIINLRTTKALVKTILEEDQRARNSDSYLYLKVIEYIAKQKQISLANITILHYLLHMKDYGFPPFESVRRARQKAQAENPELAASKEVVEQRADNETDYRNFSREGA
jgi:hypothetical protein